MTSSNASSSKRHGSHQTFELSIENALQDNAQLLSWKAAFIILNSNSKSASASNNLRQWLISSPQLSAYASCAIPFPPPNAASKQAFDSKTAAINITSDSIVPVNTLKEDASNLSAELKIDELEALRICILDFQEQSTYQDDDGGNKNNGGIDIESTEFGFQGSLWGRNSKKSGTNSNNIGASGADSSFSRDIRLHRHVKLFYSERRYLIKVTMTLVRASLARPGRTGRRSLLYHTGKKILAHVFDEKNTNPNKKGFVEEIISGIEARVHISEYPKYIKDRIGQDIAASLVSDWEREVLHQEVHLLQLVFLLVYKPVVASASVVSAWFTFMKSTNFLSNQKFLSKLSSVALQPLINSIAPLVSIVSMTILSLPKIVPHLNNAFAKQGGSANSHNPFYLDSPSTVDLLHMVLHDFVGERADPVPSLAAWTWALILQDVKEMTTEAKDYLVASVPGTTSSADDRFSSSGLIVYDSILADLNEKFGTNEESAIIVAKGAVRAGVFGVFSQLFLGVGGQGGWVLDREEDANLMRNVLIYMLRASMSIVEFDERLLQAVIAAFSLHLREDDSVSSSKNDMEEVCEEDQDSSSISRNNDATDYPEDILSTFWNDKVAIGRTIHTARCRFPFEIMPFLTLIRSLTPRRLPESKVNFALEYLSSQMDTLTQVLPQQFRGIDIDFIDSENATLNRSFSAIDAREEDGQGSITIPSGINGKVVSSGVSPPIIRWTYKYSGIQFIGRILEKAMLEEVYDGNAVIEILGIFDSILKSFRGLPVSDESIEIDSGMISTAAAVLEDASDLMASNSDVVSTIFDLHEAALSRCTDDKAIELVTATLSLTTTLLPIIPGRVWPFLERSSLLERNGRGGTLSRILETVEVVTGNYSLLLECLSLYEALVADAIKGVVITGTIGSAGSIVGREGVGSGVSKGVQMSIVENWTRFWGGIIGSFRGWKYVNGGQRTALNSRLFSIFATILNTVYGVDLSNNTTSGQGLFSVLKPSAEFLVNLFLNAEETMLPLEPIMSAISDGCSTPETTIFLDGQAAWIDSVAATLDFANIAIRVRNLLNLPPSQLERLLFKKSQALVCMYEVDMRYRLVIVELFDSLVNNSSSWNQDPPSLIGHLGQKGSKRLIRLLKKLDNPLKDEQLECAIWRLVSAILSNKQQGLSVILVMGERSEDETKKGNKSMLSMALDILSDISNLPTTISLVVLEAVSLAQNFWGTVTLEIKQHPTFIKAITGYISNLKVEFLPGDDNEATTEKCNQLATAAYIAQLLAMNLHQQSYLKGPKTGTDENALLAAIVPHLGFYTERAASISGYKPSLHGFLISNFEKKWPSCRLERLKKSALQRREYGSGYFYDIELASKVIGWDKGWDESSIFRSTRNIEKSPGKRWGFKYDVEKANLNLALVDAQVVLLRAWSLLAIELTAHIQSHPQTIPPLLGKVVVSCLQANIIDGLPVPISTSITSERAGLAFAILSRMRAHTPSVPVSTYDGILATAWEAVSSAESELLSSLSTGGDEYFRSLLRIIYIALLVEAEKSELPSTRTLQILSEIFEIVIAKGFKCLAMSVYDHKDKSEPADMLLVIGILQCLLSFKSTEPIHHAFIGHLDDNGTISAATTLFTWANRLAISTAFDTSEPDPVYGELSITFLVKLSQMSALAEQLLLSNVFTSLSEGELSSKLQDGNISPTTTPRLHNIWAKGFLPLVLNLLFSIGGRIATDVTTFVRSFIRQFDTAVNLLVKPSNISLPQISEMVDIMAIFSVLESMGKPVMEEFGIRRHVVATACDQWITHRAWLSSLVIPTSAEEDILWDGGKDGNRLVEKILESSRLLKDLIATDDEDDDMTS